MTQPRAAVKSGFVRVNGVLLGYVWILFPEVSPLAQWSATLIGAVVIAVALSRWTNFFWKRGTSVTRCSRSLHIGCLGSDRGAEFGRLSRLATLRRLGCAGRRQTAAAHTHLRRPVPQRASRGEAGRWTRLVAVPPGRVRCGQATTFRRAVDVRADFADAQDGLGWSLFRLANSTRRRRSSLRSVQRSTVADSWDGLGWLALRSASRPKPSAASAGVDRRALFADAYTGLTAAVRLSPKPLGLASRKELSQDAEATLPLNGEEPHSHQNLHWSERLARIIQYCIPSDAQRTKATQLLGWLLFIAGITWHSPYSTLMAARCRPSAWQSLRARGGTLRTAST